MHETALAISLIDLVEETARRENAARVNAIEVELGALSCVDPEAFRSAVEVAATGRVAQGARLTLLRPAGSARCMSCGGDVLLNRRDVPCPACGSSRLLVTSGDQMRLNAIEVA